MDDPLPIIGDVRDLGSDAGFQWEFRCRNCGNGYRSEFERNITGRGKGVLRMAGQWFGGDIARASYTMDSYGSGYSNSNGGAKGRHYAKAVESMLPHFRQCERCHEWRCVQACWNESAGTCSSCKPAVNPESADVARRCASCGHVSGGKFCQHCGAAMAVPSTCPGCGTKAATGAAFCSDCGTSLR